MGIPVGQSSTGTYTFAPAASDLVLYAYSLIGMRRVDLTTQHYIDASMAANLAMVNLSNHMPMRFGLETQTLLLVQGTATYNLATRTIAARATYIVLVQSSLHTHNHALAHPRRDHHVHSERTELQAASGRGSDEPQGGRQPIPLPGRPGH